MNVDYILRADGTGNFTEESDLGTDDFAAHNQIWSPLSSVAADTTANGYAVAKGMVWGAIVQSQANPQMLLPAGNTTPNPPKQITYVLGGVYFHRDDYFYNYDQPSPFANPAGALDPSLFNAYGINKGTELNIFMLGQNTNEPDYDPLQPGGYIIMSGGASGWGYHANNVWFKSGNVWRRRLYEKSTHNG